MLVVGEVVVQRSILLRGHVLEKNRHGNIFDLDGKYVSPPEETVTMVANVHQAGGSGTFWGKLRGKDESAVVPATCSYFIDQKVI